MVMIKSEAQNTDLYTLLWGTDIKYSSQTQNFNDLHIKFTST